MSRPDRYTKFPGEVPEWNAALCPLSPKLGNLYPRQLAQRKWSQNLAVRPCIRQSGLHSFRDQRPLELGNTPDHLKHQLTGWQRAINSSGCGFAFRIRSNNWAV